MSAGRRPPLALADPSASIIVCLIALPVSLGIALATGSPLRAGLVAAAAAAWALDSAGGAPLARVDLPSWRGHALPELPRGTVAGPAAAVLTVTLVTSVQSLLSAVAVDKLAATRSDGRAVLRPDLDKELLTGALGLIPLAALAALVMAVGVQWCASATCARCSATGSCRCTR